jgi:site-specific DNA-cytosine methylase
MSVTATDLFCGAGGSSIGFELAGGELRLGLNHWQRERMAQYGNAVTPPVMTEIVRRLLPILDEAGS